MNISQPSVVPYSVRMKMHNSSPTSSLRLNIRRIPLTGIVVSVVLGLGRSHCLWIDFSPSRTFALLRHRPNRILSMHSYSESWTIGAWHLPHVSPTSIGQILSANNPGETLRRLVSGDVAKASQTRDKYSHFPALDFFGITTISPDWKIMILTRGL